jgi:hypothetical protein
MSWFRKRNAKPGEVEIQRFTHKTDPDRDKTEITVYGRLSSRKLQDIKDVLSGKSTAHRRPGKGVQA